jgi:hypothetical protein
LFPEIQYFFQCKNAILEASLSKFIKFICVFDLFMMLADVLCLQKSAP